MGSLITALLAFTAESDGEKSLKINQHLVKLWAIKYSFVSL